MLRLGCCFFAGTILAGCAIESPQPRSQMIWLRLDGQRGAGSPRLTQQFETDRKICLGDAQQDNEVDAAAKACMAEKGYIQVPVDQAEAKRRELAAANAKRQAPVSLPR